MHFKVLERRDRAATFTTLLYGGIENSLLAGVPLHSSICPIKIQKFNRGPEFFSHKETGTENIVTVTVCLFHSIELIVAYLTVFFN
jgi:hypothetical protein